MNPSFGWEAFAPLALAALAAGLARGFSGFGAAMIFMPPAATLLGPQAAVVTLYVIDAAMTAPLLASAVGGAGWRAIAPLALGALVGTPLGAAALAIVDPVVMRWAVSVSALAVVAVFLTGWRYSRTPSAPLSVAVGGASGFLGGIAGFTGPPVVLFYLGGPDRAGAVRANIIRFFFCTTVFAGASYIAFGFFDRAVVLDALFLLPLYGAGTLIGARVFGLASERVFRGLAYLFIAIAATLSLPLWDG